MRFSIGAMLSQMHKGSGLRQSGQSGIASGVPPASSSGIWDMARYTLHEAGQRAWGLRPGPPYRPHLSLLYARDLPEERKPAIADGLGLALPVTIRVDAAEIWADFRDEVTRWRRVARVVLTG